LALELARSNNGILLTGDRLLINAARQAGVECHGTIWAFDQLQAKGIIDAAEESSYMKELLKLNKSGRRLPKEEIVKRII
jgi:hypothetical protein